MIKVFLSHQRADSESAAVIAATLRRQSIDSYLDVIDPYINRNIEDLADHIREQMGKCTQLLAVVSRATAESQWVPWEIGVATEKDYPLATFSVGSTLPPEFLRKWPYLRTQADVDQYAKASKDAEQTIVRKQASDERLVRRSATRDFYSTLRKSLGQ
uniref:TIR domain protein n=1 Tax=Rhizobium rhizogenes TaxID=359 RepID=A0A7S4ZSY4_RHIRH|nr:toll/interleukin-1 receptor domain-containing protein [Rhizobium rhizogenes]QCL10610.1 TIR domain protein [Rhizobium rhizogenes]